MYQMEAWRQELYLAHHGIKGMKWGRRQGPPYPLDAQDHSAAEKKAGWRKSLNGGSGEESKPKKRLTKEPSGGLNGKEITSHDFDKEKAKRLARNVAIGAAVVGVALGGAYLYKNRGKIVELAGQYKQKIEQQIEVRENQRRYEKKSREIERTLSSRGHSDMLDDFGSKRRSYYLARTPISELNDDDEIIRAGTQFQRMIKADSVEQGIMSEKVKDIMYAAYEENDKSLYYHQIGVRAEKKAKATGKNAGSLAMQMTANKDIKVASERKRVQTFVDLMQDDEFRNAFRYDRMHSKVLTTSFAWAQTGDFNKGNDWTKGHEQESYRVFQHLLGDENSKARKVYLDKIVSMGYNAIIDDNDADAFAHKPIILLTAQKDVTITGAQAVSEMLDMLNLAKIGDINAYLDGK